MAAILVVSVISKDSDVSVSQLSVSKSVHVLDVHRQLVVDRLICVSLVPTFCLQGEELNEVRKERQVREKQ